jgi:WW domain-containing oxidoreductase
MLSSDAHHRAPEVGIDFDDLTLAKSYTAWSAYGQSKLANLLFAKSLAKRLAGTGKTANALHPGVIQTNLVRHMNLAVRVALPIAAALAMKSIPQGSATQCYVATHPSLANVSGEYFADCNVAKPSRHARNDAMAERLWEVTEAIVAAL